MWIPFGIGSPIPPVSPGSVPREAIHVEDLLGVQQVVDHPTQLVREDREPLATAVLALQLRQALLESFVLLGTEESGLGEGPLQPGVAAPGVAHADDLAGRLLLGGDQPGVAAELLAALEATDGVDLQQDGHRDDPADPGDGLQRGEFGGVVLLGGDLDVAFESSDLGVEWAEQVQSRLDAAAGVLIGDVGGDGLALALVLHITADGVEVELPADGVDVAVEFGPLSDESQSGAEQVA